MQEAPLKLVAWVLGISVLMALIVPDFSHENLSIGVIQVLVPLAIAAPVVSAVLSSKLSMTSGIILALVGIAIHSFTSAVVYLISAGSAAFFDGVTVPILIGSTALKVLAVALVFIAGSGYYAIVKRRRHG